jgi:cellulose synthase/poly-beta-1,6-N-acetylglucosamine synthase-like glycosyltransferase
VSALLTFVAWALALAAAVPLAVFTLEVTIGLFGARRAAPPEGGRRVAVLIPAHDEAAGIGATLEALRVVAPPGTRVLVVADNCSDDTAAVARAHGAEVAERVDTSARGKGYALAFGRDRLAEGPPLDAVIVLDADCRLAPGSVEALAEACTDGSGRPAQSINLIAPDPDASPMTQISGFAMLVKNLYRSRGMQRMGGAALLTGTGMAFPWSVFATASLASGSLVEDLGLGIALTRAGHAPRLIESAGVRSAPPPDSVALVQRTRWEHGFLDTVRRSALPLLGSGLRRGALAEVLLALHLMVPPLALLLIATAGVLFATGLLHLLGASVGPVTAVAAALGATLLATFAAWLHGGRPWLRAGALLRAPLYVLWKLPIYLGFLRRRETEWRRTPRAGE